MYLKRIELQGFKSFTAKTAVSFEPGISCIVGPNGSGKSNIADALRWVLGEQNARSIRGGKLEDVIFAGTLKRRPLGMAEVTIVLDNTDNYLPLPFAEISVSRRAVRNGSSEYLINGQPCRLRDIRDLFMDTGIGVEGVSLINQGRINELINARPDERRVLVEEAAGIVKYRDRKKEAVRKLAETERHLETVNAVINELSARIEPLSVQAARAEQFLALRDEADQLQIGISVRVLSEAETAISELAEKIGAKERQLLSEEARCLALAAEAEALRLLINEHDESVEADSQSFYQLQTSQEKEEGSLRLLLSRRDNAAQSQERLAQELTHLEGLIAVKEQETAELSAHVERTAAEIMKEEESILHGEGGESDIKSQIILLSEQLAARQKEMNILAAEHAATANQLDFKQQLRDKNQETITRLADEEADIRQEQELRAQEQDTLLSRQEQIRAMLKEQSTAAHENELLLRRLNQELAEAAADEADIKYQTTSAGTRVTMLSEMAAGYEGFFPGVKALMAAKRQGKAGQGIIGVISQLMDVPELYRSSIEAYLGANIQNVVAEDADSAQAAIAYLKQQRLGRATFLPLDILKIRPAADISAIASMRGVHGLASALVDCEQRLRPAVDFLLNRVVIAEDMPTAMAAAKALQYRLSVVTVDGDMVNPGASVSGGSRGKKAGELLGQRSRLEQAERELAALESELNRHSEQVAALRLALHAAKEASDEISGRMQALSTEQNQINNLCQQSAYAAETQEQRLQALAAEQAALLQENQGIDSETADLQEEYQRSIAENEQLTERSSRLQAELASLQERMSGQQSSLTNRKMSLASSRQKLHGQNLTLSRLQEELLNLGWEAEEKSADLDAAAAEVEDYQQQIKNSEQSLRVLGLEIHQRGSQLELLKHGLAAESAQLIALEKEEKEAAKQRERYQNENHQLALRKERWQADFENEAAKLAERFGLDLALARARVGDDIGSRTAMSSRLNQVKREMSALGEVNLGAISEYAEVKERFDFLFAQRGDMLAAREKLDKVIAEMDRIMIGRFRSAYQQLSQAFDQSFSRLFGGGSAALYLSQPDDILETGVELRVDPPGKKVANYNLLSGGEKALIGIALMFAMLTVRPTPFCVMDEVDAALDEANISRFTDFLLDKAADSQFVMITHRQSTMEAASVLWGITMEEEGISTVLSVKLDEAV